MADSVEGPCDAGGVPKCTDTAPRESYPPDTRAATVLDREGTMSERNGDKARFQRQRKAGLLRRRRARAVWATIQHAGIRTQSGGERDPALGRLSDAVEKT
jgi:hypothetical protein